MRAFLNSNQKAFPSLKGFSPRRGLSRNTSTSSISNRQLGHKYKPPFQGAVLNIDLIILITDLTYGSIKPSVTTRCLGAITEIFGSILRQMPARFYAQCKRPEEATDPCTEFSVILALELGFVRISKKGLH